MADFLTRRLTELCPDGDRAAGSIHAARAGQEVLERTSVLIGADRVEARLEVGLPAEGRRVRGRRALALLGQEIPRIADAALRLVHLDEPALRRHVALYRDQEALRDLLAGLGLVAFVGDGAVLPRRSGDSDLPLAEGAVPFTGPDSLRVDVEIPGGRRVSGMGIPEGVTVIVGGGYHGKSTLLRAIERGVHPHIAGDGREWVITRRDAVSVRAEDGRAVTGVDISAFIAGLPSGADTSRFSTGNASGSTSQAANLVEAVDAGASALLIDEDTSATNFMIRDDRMRRLIPADREPITPFVERVRPLRAERGVSTILVAGGSGAFFDVADRVIAMDAYRPRDVTARALALAGREPSFPASALREGASDRSAPVLPAGRPRVPAAGSLGPDHRGRGARMRGPVSIQLGDRTIDLSAVGQLVDGAQTAALAKVLDRLAERFDGRTSIAEAVAGLDALIDAEGLDVLSAHGGHPGVMARPRIAEMHAAVNRHRGLRLMG